MPYRKYKYDEDKLVELLVEKQMTHEQIAGELGISVSLVGKIACGLRRPELQRRMLDVENGLLSKARWLGARFARGLISHQIQLGLKGKGDQARRAREFVLKFAMSAQPKREELPHEVPPPMPGMEKQLAWLGLLPAVEEEEMVASSRWPIAGEGEGGSTRKPGAGGKEQEQQAVTQQASSSHLPAGGGGNPERGGGE